MTGLLEAVALEENLRKPSPTVCDLTVVHQEPISSSLAKKRMGFSHLVPTPVFKCVVLLFIGQSVLCANKSSALELAYSKTMRMLGTVRNFPTHLDLYCKVDK